MHEPRKRLHSARRKNLDTTWSRKMCLLLARRKRQARSGVQGLRLRYSRQDGRAEISPDEKFLPPDRLTVPIVLPACNTEAMNLHLAEITKEIAPGRHAALLLDQAGWHLSRRLIVPENI